MTARSFSPNAFATLACVAVAALALVGKSSGAVDAGTKARFSGLPARVAQGKEVTVTVAVATGARCSLTVRYGDGNLQAGLPTVRSAGRRARWHWRVPDLAATGPAKLIVSCGAAGTLTGALPVVAGPKSTDVTVTQRGFTQRVRNGRATVSWGLVLANRSPDRDSLGVTVIVNFVDATNTVLGTDTEQIDGIAAGGPYYLGGGATVPTTPIQRLEVIIQVASRAPRLVHEPPVEDIRIIPNRENYVGAVVGQIANDRPGNLLRRAGMSTVIFDAKGNVVGGTTGSMYDPLPSGTRAYFEASLNGDSVPMAIAATAKVSVEPRFEVAK